LGHYPIPTTGKEVIIHEDGSQTVEQKGGLFALTTEKLAAPLNRPTLIKIYAKINCNTGG